MYKFDVKKTTEDCIAWIQDWFEKNGPGCNAVLGMSGGKDSTIAAALCAKALGPERVIGVAMPDRGQGIADADKICEYLGIRYMNVPIDGITGEFLSIWYRIGDEDFKWSSQAEQNIPPRVRMTLLYAISQTWNGRPVCTCNLSEDFIGYSTIFGDSAGAFSPLGGLTVSEIYQIGDYLGIPSQWVHKVPDDGLPHSRPDEEKFGFTYKDLDMYIRRGHDVVDLAPDTLSKIEKMHESSEFKREVLHVETFWPEVEE